MLMDWIRSQCQRSKVKNSTFNIQNISLMRWDEGVVIPVLHPFLPANFFSLFPEL